MSGITKADLERYASKPEADTLTRDLASHALTLTAKLTAAEQRISDLKFALGDGAGWFDRAMAAEQQAADLARRLAVVEGAAFAFEHAVGDARLSGAARYRRGLLVNTLTGAEKRGAASPAPRAEQDSSGPGDAGNMPDGRLSGALTDRSATSVISPAPRVIAPGDVLRCERCRWPLAADATKGCVPGNCSFRCACSPGAHGMTCPLHHLNAKPTPIATPTQAASEAMLRDANMRAPNGPECWCGKPSMHQSGWCGVCVIEPAPVPTHTIMVGGLLGDRPYNERGTRALEVPAPAPDAGEAAPASVWCTYYVSSANGSVSVGMVELTKEAMEEDMRRCSSAAAGARLAGPYVLATVAKTDEDRARTIVDKDMCAHHDEYMVERITALLATIRAAHRAEVAEAEAARAALDAQHQVTLRALQDQIDSLETSMSQAAGEGAEWHSRYTQAVKDAVAAEGRAYERAAAYVEMLAGYADARGARERASVIREMVGRIRALGAK